MYGVIDVGTTGVKLSVFTKSLERVYFEKLSIGFEKVGSGLVEQDSFKLAEVVKGYAKKARSLGAKMIGLCTYRASVLAWKKGGKPLSNIITWVDGRGKVSSKGFPSTLSSLDE